MEVDIGLREYIEENILPLYEGHDAAHGPEHVRVVLENSFELAAGLEVDINMVYTVAAYHDVGVSIDRKRHEIISGEWLWNDRELESWFTSEQRWIMREAVEDHRASRQEPPRNIYGRIVSEADRDLAPERILRRVAQYSLDNYPELDSDGHVRRAAAHIQEKYGEEGYMRLWLPCPRNEKGLETLREWLRTGELEGKLRGYLRMYMEER